jgi:hypothetical protein
MSQLDGAGDALREMFDLNLPPYPADEAVEAANAARAADNGITQELKNTDHLGTRVYAESIWERMSWILSLSINSPKSS